MKGLVKAENLLFSLLLFFGVSVAWKGSGSVRDFGIDFYQFWAVGQSLHRADVHNIYSPEDRARLSAEFLERAKNTSEQRFVSAAEYRKEFETYSTPFLYSLFQLFSTGDYERDFKGYRVFLIALLLFSVGLFARLCGLSWTMTLGAGALFPAWFLPFSSELRVGNVNCIQLAALAAYLWVVMKLRWKWKDVLGGSILGFALAFKPNLIFVAGALAVHFLLDGRARRLVDHAIGGTAAFVFAFFVSSASFGSVHCWTDWLAVGGSIPSQIITLALGNFAPSRVVLEWLGFDPAIWLAVIFAAAVLFVFFRTRRPRHPPCPLDDYLALAIGCLLAVLVTQLAWLHYFLFTIPILILLLRPFEGTSPPRAAIFWRRVVPGLALLGLTIEPIVNLGVEIDNRAAGVMIGVSTVLLLAAALVERAWPSITADIYSHRIEKRRPQAAARKDALLSGKVPN
jgi:hypothetical protein